MATTEITEFTRMPGESATISQTLEEITVSNPIGATYACQMWVERPDGSSIIEARDVTEKTVDDLSFIARIEDTETTNWIGWYVLFVKIRNVTNNEADTTRYNIFFSKCG